MLVLINTSMITQSNLPISANTAMGLQEIKAAVDPDFSAILKEADFYRGGHVLGISWDLRVENIEKEKLKNEIFLRLEGSAIEERLFALASFLAPKKYKGQKLLVRDNNMWYAKPGLRRPVAISSRQRLSGSAANADIASANYYHDYDIVSTKETILNDQACWVMELEAKNNLVSYPRLKYWIAKDAHLGLKTEYYGKSGKLIKYAVFEYDNKIKYEKKDYDFISRVIIYDSINRSNKTILNLSNIVFRNFSNSKFQKSRLLD